MVKSIIIYDYLVSGKIILALPPKSLIRNTRKGKTILKPSVPIKLSSSIGKSEICSLLCTLATINCYLASLSTFQ
ncbi:MAG TPA: hypothetical protein VE445_08385 [Nitrososphaeraceae archaeon]|nr:hypothetical protein [Nitrososphaeraceae archaeon]